MATTSQINDLINSLIGTDFNIWHLKKLITHYIDNHYTETLATTQPMISKELKIPNGIEITGKFKTNDGSTEGRPMYVTTLRQSNRTVVQDGFGFVVIKGTGSEYNVFLVDHNLMVSGYTFGDFLQVPNINSYMGGEGILGAARAKISINTEYSFRFQINDNWATDLRIWKTGEDYTSSTWDTMPYGPLTHGALADGPLSYGGTQIQSPITGQLVELPKGTDFGIAIDNPGEYQWYISDIQVRKFTGGYPLQIFEFSNLNLITGPVQVNYYGHSEYDSGTLGEVDIYIAKVDDPLLSPESQNIDSDTPWIKLGTTNMYGTIRRLRHATLEDASYYSIGNKFYIAALAIFPEGTDLATTSIKTDYIEVTRAENLKIIDRSALDIWIDPINILSKTSSGEILLGNEGRTQVTEVTHPIFLIEKIYQPDYPEVNLFNAGITQYNPLNGLLYSDRDLLTLSHPQTGGIYVKIDYWNCGTMGTALTNFVNNTKYRGPGQDILVRVAPPTVFKINTLMFDGPQSVNDIKNLIVEYINSLGSSGTLRKSDIISLLYINGVTRLYLNTIDFEVIVYDYIELLYDTFVLTDEYTRPDTPGRWFTHSNFLNITKHG